jgi:hypothetical protein
MEAATFRSLALGTEGLIQTAMSIESRRFLASANSLHYFTVDEISPSDL